jgi:hypothetical protein
VSDEIDYLVELRGVYDGWSIAVHKDGTLRNRWAGDDGNAKPGYERRWLAAEDAIALMRSEASSGEHQV